MTVRLATAADAAGVLAIYAPFVRDTHVSFEETVPTVDEIAGRIEAVAPVHPWLAAVDGERVVGYAYAGPHRSRAAYRWSVEVSVYVAETQRQRGVGRELYRALLDVLRLQGFATAYAGIALPNASSVAFHESLGFELVGVYRRVGFKAGAWHDVGWWALCLGEGAAPASPRALTDVADAVSARLAEAGRALGEGRG